MVETKSPNNPLNLPFTAPLRVHEYILASSDGDICVMDSKRIPGGVLTRLEWRVIYVSCSSWTQCREAILYFHNWGWEKMTDGLKATFLMSSPKLKYMNSELDFTTIYSCESRIHTLANEAISGHPRNMTDSFDYVLQNSCLLQLLKILTSYWCFVV